MSAANLSRRLGKLLSVAALSLALPVSSEFRFTDVTAVKHLDFKHEGSPTSNKYLIETMGGGVALIDYDNDGRLDVFFTNGAALTDPMPQGKTPDKSEPRFWNRLYRQNSDGSFTDVTEKADVSGKSQNLYNMGVAAGDYNNDGFTDLYVTGYSGAILYRNRGDGTFTDETAKAGVATPGWSSSVGFFDYNNDGKLDLFVGRYVEWTFQTNRYCGEQKPGGRAYCHPDNFKGVTNILYRNNGDGTFTDVSRKAGIANPEGKALGVAFADFDNDGWTDIYVANDSVQCFLYRNNRDGTFTDISLTSGTGFNEDGSTFAGMGADFSDFDNDGWPDIVVTNLSNQRYVLFRNNRDGTFTDLTTASGLGRATFPYSGWSTAFVDLDKDGWKDLFVAQGHVMDTIHMTSPNLKYMQPPLLLRNLAGKFSKPETGPIFERAWAGRAAAFGDMDNDGDIDIVVGNVNQKAYILRNDADSQGAWIGLKLTGVRSNRDGIGSRVKVTSPAGPAQYFTVNTAVGYQSASDKRLLIGLGSDKTARIEVLWSGGAVQKIDNVKAGQWLPLAEPAK